MRRLLLLLLCWLLLMRPLAAWALNMGSGGTGNALVTGTPSEGQVAIWVDATHVEGVSVLTPAHLPTASSTTTGVLASADWSTFNAKQAPLGFTPENSANRNPSAALGTSNTDYPTQGAVKLYVDSGTKALTNTALTPRPCTGANAATIVMNADNLTGCDFVQVAELSQPTTFDLTAGTYVNGQFLSLLIFTTTQRALVFATGAGKFAAEGITLPTFSRAAGYVLYGFRYNALSNRWALVASSQTTNYGTAGYVQTAGGPGVEPSWQAAAGGLAGTTGERLLPITAVDFPATNPAILSRGSNSGIPVLRFDNGTPWCASWGPFRMNADYASLPIFKLQYSMESVTGAFGVAIDVYVMAITPGDAADPDDDSNYGTVNTCPDTPVPSVAGHFKEISCALTNNDSLAAGDLTKVKLCRNTGHATDNAAGIMEALTAAILFTK